ncbi:hypothetical protein LCGC14_0908980 [marine sediment metagenome]|uniref:Uncharacterized protein n=1 Tax=marine sediment metagenome TaxID=412755 RepID=A0A0F9PEW8_9ZZZZ
MTASAIFLTEKDRDLLQGLLDKERKGRVNTPSRPQQERSYAEAQDYLAPETYIALPPGGGIPAFSVVDLTGTGTIVAGEIGTPGFAECDVYKIVGGELVAAGFTKDVYNLSPREIPREVTIERSPTVTLVTSVCFDETDCELTICDREICFPVGTVIEPEDCGDAATGTGPCDVETGTGTEPLDDLVLNFIIIHREKFGVWIVSVSPVLSCESPITGTGT